MDGPEYQGLVKKYFLWTGGICLGTAALFLAVFYILDPMQFFHRSKVENCPLYSDMRVQAAGILNSFDIDSIILGTSMLQNTSASEASEKLGGKFFNISFSGGSFAERSPILKKALQKNLKNVLYSLDSYYQQCLERTESLPAYLYDDNIFNDFKYYLTLKNIKNIFKINNGLPILDHDRPNAWHDHPARRKLFGGIEHWAAHKNDRHVRPFFSQQLPSAAKTFHTAKRDEVHDKKRESLAKQYVEKYILDIIKNHRDTNFYLIFPPYSRFNYALMRRTSPKSFFLHQEIIRYLVDSTKDYKNIHIYGFEDQDFLDDIANYKDIIHYHQKFNSMFLDAMAAGTHELTPENVEDYLKHCEQKAWDYDIPALNARVQELLKAGEVKEKG